MIENVPRYVVQFFCNMPNIIPLRELKNASKISKICHESNEPVFVTKNGVSDLVIMTSNEYDKISKNDSYVFHNEADQVKEPNLIDYIKERDCRKIYTISELKKTLKPILAKHKVKKAVLFGSYVKGTADARSDIDLLVETDLKGWDFYGLLGDVTDALRFPVDLIEKRTIKRGSEFEKEIEDTGVTIYG